MWPEYLILDTLISDDGERSIDSAQSLHLSVGSALRGAAHVLQGNAASWRLSRDLAYIELA